VAAVHPDGIVVFRNVEIEGTVLDGSLENRYPDAVPTRSGRPEFDPVGTVVVVYHFQGDGVGLLFGSDREELGFDRVAAGFALVAVVVDGAQRDGALDAGDHVALYRCRTQAGKGGAGADSAQDAQLFLNDLEAVVLVEVARKEGVFAGFPQARGGVQFLGEALDALGYVADFHLVLQPLALLFHLKRTNNKCFGPNRDLNTNSSTYYIFIFCLPYFFRFQSANAVPPAPSSFPSKSHSKCRSSPFSDCPDTLAPVGM
jgi:hypothetical protein